MTIVKFGPFLSTAEVSFWTSLAEKKLNVLKLSEEPLDITGTYSGAFFFCVELGFWCCYGLFIVIR